MGVIRDKIIETEIQLLLKKDYLRSFININQLLVLLEI